MMLYFNPHSECGLEKKFLDLGHTTAALKTDAINASLHIQSDLLSTVLKPVFQNSVHCFSCTLVQDVTCLNGCQLALGWLGLGGFFSFSSALVMSRPYVSWNHLSWGVCVL